MRQENKTIKSAWNLLLLARTFYNQSIQMYGRWVIKVRVIKACSSVQHTNCSCSHCHWAESLVLRFKTKTDSYTLWVLLMALTNLSNLGVDLS